MFDDGCRLVALLGSVGAALFPLLLVGGCATGPDPTIAYTPDPSEHEDESRNHEAGSDRKATDSDLSTLEFVMSVAGPFAVGVVGTGMGASMLRPSVRVECRFKEEGCIAASGALIGFGLLNFAFSIHNLTSHSYGEPLSRSLPTPDRTSSDDDPVSSDDDIVELEMAEEVLELSTTDDESE